MPKLRTLVSKFGDNRTWTDAGNEWSTAWGGADREWFGSILPRIRSHLPTQTILEIAPGLGRWTNFLKDHCKKLIAVDINTNCIEECRRRFQNHPSMLFYANDGKSLSMVEDASIDFVFSFDSLVHVEADVLDAYLAEFARVLAPLGVAFIHHSNFADCLSGPIANRVAHVPVVRHLLLRTGAFGVNRNQHWRAESVSARIVRDLCEKHGLHCTRQEMVNWGHTILTDCFTSISRAHASGCEVIENLDFMKEAEKVRQSAQVTSHI